MPQRITLRLETQAFDLEYFESYGGKSTRYEGNVQRTMVSLGYYPVGNHSACDFRFNVGIEMGFLVHESFTGYYNTGYYGVTPDTTVSNSEISSRVELGPSINLSYQIKIFNGWHIVPHYRAYFGLLRTEAEIDYLSFSNYIEVGIMKDLFDRDAFKAKHINK